MSLKRWLPSPAEGTSSRSPRFVALFIAIAVVLASLLRAALEPILDDNVPFITYFPIVVLAAWSFGLRAALITVAVSALAAAYWFIPPDWSLAIRGVSAWASLLVFAGMGAAIGIIAETQRSAARRAARALEESIAGERRFRELWEQSIEGRYTLDVDGKITDINPALEGMLRRPRSELLGRAIADLIVPDQVSYSRSMLDRKLAGEPVTTYELDIRTGDGRVRTLEITSRLVRHETGKAEIHGSARDISDRKVADQALRESEERLALAAQATGFGAYDDQGAGRVYWSPELKNIFGLPADFNPNGGAGTALELIHPDDRDGWRSALAAARDPNGPGIMQDEHRIVRPDGQIVWVAQRGRILFVGEGRERRAVRAIGVVADITTRKQTEARIAALQQLAAACAGALTPADVAGVLLRTGLAAMDAAAATVALIRNGALRVIGSEGYDARELEPFREHSLDANVPYADAVRNQEPVWLETMADWRQRYPALAATHEAVGLGRSAILPLVVDGGVIGVLGISFRTHGPFAPEERVFLGAVADTCAQALDRARLYEEEQAARDAAQQALHIRDEFLGSVSHDLRSPLTTLRGTAQLVHRQLARLELPNTERLLEHIRRMEETAMRMNSMVEELVDAARLDAGRTLELDQHDMDLVAMLERLVRDYQRETASHALRLDAARPGLTGHWDANRLERAFSNLLSNAIKYSPRGGDICISVAPWQDSHGRDGARVTIVDQGIGIPAADLPHIFERFHRAGNVTGRVSGTGIGLAGARRIIEQHGGAITVDSVEGSGTTVTVTLPLGGSPE